MKMTKLPDLKVWRARRIVRRAGRVVLRAVRGPLYEVTAYVPWGKAQATRVGTAGQMLSELAKLNLSGSQADEIMAWGRDEYRVMSTYGALADRVSVNASLGRCSRVSEDLFAEVSSLVTFEVLTKELLGWIGWLGEKCCGVERVQDRANLVSVAFLKDILRSVPNASQGSALCYLFAAPSSPDEIFAPISVALSPEAINYVIGIDASLMESITNISSEVVEELLSQPDPKLRSTGRYIAEQSPKWAHLVERVVSRLQGAQASVPWTAVLGLCESYKSIRCGSVLSDSDLLAIASVADEGALVAYLARESELLVVTESLIPQVIALAQNRFPGIWARVGVAARFGRYVSYGDRYAELLVELVPGLAWTIVATWSEREAPIPVSVASEPLYKYVCERVAAVGSNQELNWSMFHDWDRDKYSITLTKFCDVLLAQNRLRESVEVV
jgi:hypothetical protein